MTWLFRSRLPPPLSTTEVTRLSNLSDWSESDILHWYERFVHCYPSGYLTLNDFGAHLQYITIFQNHHSFQLDNYIIKEIFHRFDKDNDQKLNFEEIFQCHLFIHGESDRMKLKFILQLYHRNKTKYYSRAKVFDTLMNLFDLFNMHGERFEREKKLVTIIYQIEPNDREKNKISWTNMCRSMKKEISFFKYLLSDDDDAAETNSITHL